MVKKRKRRIPKAWIVLDKKSHTISLRDDETGRMLGRRKVKSGSGDRTKIRRIVKGKYKGQLLGRSSSIPIRATKGRRGTVRRRL